MKATKKWQSFSLVRYVSGQYAKLKKLSFAKLNKHMDFFPTWIQPILIHFTQVPSNAMYILCPKSYIWN
jgi:hypothetical protein